LERPVHISTLWTHNEQVPHDLEL